MTSTQTRKAPLPERKRKPTSSKHKPRPSVHPKNTKGISLNDPEPSQGISLNDPEPIEKLKRTLKKKKKPPKKAPEVNAFANLKKRIQEGRTKPLKNRTAFSERKMAYEKRFNHGTNAFDNIKKRIQEGRLLEITKKMSSLKNRKAEDLKRIFEKAKPVKKVVIPQTPKERENWINQEYKQEAFEDKVFVPFHLKSQTNNMDPEIVNELEKASRLAEIFGRDYYKNQEKRSKELERKGSVRS